MDVETVIIGGGQAGLSVGYHLARRKRPFVILDANKRIGDNWRCHYDSLRLYSPARYDGLPGMAFPAPAWSFPTRDQMADYLVAYAASFNLRVHNGVRVERVSRGNGRYTVECSDRRYEADNVVVATGTFGRKPSVPEFAAGLASEIVQLHSSEYRNLAQLKAGPVLVVGASHSGGDIAYETAASHQTVLSGRDTGQIPFRFESRKARVILPIFLFLATHVLTVNSPMGRKLREEIRFHGGPLLRVKREDLARAGVERVAERIVGVRDGRPVLAGGRVLDVANVIWCTGFRQDFSWIDLPVIGADGWPLEKLGAVPTSPGLYFSGLAFQRAFSSMLVGGAGRDAEHVAKLISREVRGGDRASTADTAHAADAGADAAGTRPAR